MITTNFLLIILAVFIGTLIENILLGVVNYILQQRAKRRMSERAVAGAKLTQNYSRRKK